jgi:hypothetical protein
MGNQFNDQKIKDEIKLNSNNFQCPNMTREASVTRHLNKSNQCQTNHEFDTKRVNITRKRTPRLAALDKANGVPRDREAGYIRACKHN